MFYPPSQVAGRRVAYYVLGIVGGRKGKTIAERGLNETKRILNQKKERKKEINERGSLEQIHMYTKLQGKVLKR